MRIIFIRTRPRKITASDIIILILLVVLIILTVYNLTLVLKNNKTTKAFKIGVIDSLVDNRDLKKYDVVETINFVEDTKVIDHGTTVLSIIKEKNDAQIYYASVLDSNLMGDIDNVVSAIYWCVDKKVNIINMSFATTQDDPKLRKAVRYAQDNDIIVVASCMNYYNGYSYPAMYPGVMSVTDGSFDKAKFKLNKQVGTSYGSAYLTNELARQLMNKSH
jgi:hypothetical protein